MAVIETPRLLMRPPEAGDVHELWEIHQDPDVMRFMDTTERDLSVAWRCVAVMVGHWQMRGYGPWVLISKRDGRMVGRTGLWNVAGGPGLELGWMVRRPDWGKGFATEAATAALAWAWQHVPDDHVISLIEPGNARSIRVAEKIGQRLEGRTSTSGREMCTYGVQRPARQTVVAPRVDSPLDQARLEFTGRRVDRRPAGRPSTDRRPAVHLPTTLAS